MTSSYKTWYHTFETEHACTNRTTDLYTWLVRKKKNDYFRPVDLMCVREDKMYSSHAPWKAKNRIRICLVACSPYNIRVLTIFSFIVQHIFGVKITQKTSIYYYNYYLFILILADTIVATEFRISFRFSVINILFNVYTRVIFLYILDSERSGDVLILQWWYFLFFNFLWTLFRVAKSLLS